MVLMKRLKAEEGKVLSFKQAERYDRLGRFLLRFPRFVLQLQLVSLADWHKKFGAKVLMDSLESLLEEEQLQFWQEPVSLAHEMAAKEPQRDEVVAERTAADEGNVCVSRHKEEDLDGGIGAVAEAAVQHGAGRDLAAVGTAAAGHGGGQALGSLGVGRWMLRREKKKRRKRRRAPSARREAKSSSWRAMDPGRSTISAGSATATRWLPSTSSTI